MRCTLAVAVLMIALSGSLNGQQASGDPLHDVVIGDGTLHLTQTQTQAALVRMARALCKQIYPSDTSAAHLCVPSRDARCAFAAGALWRVLQ